MPSQPETQQRFTVVAWPSRCILPAAPSLHSSTLAVAARTRRQAISLIKHTQAMVLSVPPNFLAEACHRHLPVWVCTARAPFCCASYSRYALIQTFTSAAPYPAILFMSTIPSLTVCSRPRCQTKATPAATEVQKSTRKTSPVIHTTMRCTQARSCNTRTTTMTIKMSRTASGLLVRTLLRRVTRGSMIGAIIASNCRFKS